MAWTFRDFPYDFENNCNFLIDLFASISSEIPSLQNLPYQNINFYGCYPQRNFLQRAVHRTAAQWSQTRMVSWLASNQGFRINYPNSDLNVWMTFENRRPPHSKFDLTLSFDIDDYNQTNVYFPLIYAYTDLLNNSSSYVRHRITIETAQNPRELSHANRNKFACVFISNPEAQRMRVIEALRKIGPVDVFGRVSGNYVKNKIETASQYKFQICLENDLYPGYITEKPLEAWISGNIPIYSGLDTQQILNPKSVLNLASLQNLESLLDSVNDLRKNDDAREFMMKEPLLSKNYGLNEIKTKIINRLISLS